MHGGLLEFTVKVRLCRPDLRKGSAFPHASLSDFCLREGCAFLRPPSYRSLRQSVLASIRNTARRLRITVVMKRHAYRR